MKKSFVFLALICGNALAADISARIAAGNSAAAAGPEGVQYDSLLGPAVQAALGTCVPAGSETPANLGKFTLVGEVAQAGAVSLVEVEPSTAISRCFAAAFASQRLPTPPTTSGEHFPLTLVMSIVP